jgi:hypothetical protein
MLQAGRWRVRIPMRLLDFSIDSIFQESSWGKRRPAREADNLTAIFELII